MWNIFEVANGVKKLIGTAWSESQAWLVCRENNSIARAARGIRFVYEAA